MEDVHRRQTSATEVRWRGGGRPARSAEHRARERFGAPLARSSSARAAHSGTVMRREIARNTVAMSGARARQPTALRSIYLAPVGRSRGGQATRPRCSRQAARAASHRSKPAHESREHRCSEDRPHSSEHSAAAVSPCPGVGRRRAPCGSVKTTSTSVMAATRPVSPPGPPPPQPCRAPRRRRPAATRAGGPLGTGARRGGFYRRVVCLETSEERPCELRHAPTRSRAPSL
jgi:hypothetical protein